MSLRKIIHEAVFGLLKEKEDIGVVQQLILSMEENGIEFIEKQIDKENFDEPISLVVTAKNNAFPYHAWIYMDYTVTKKKYEEPAIWGSSVDTSRAPFVEPAEWELDLLRVQVVDEDGDGDYYNGKDAFLKFFEDNYDTFYYYLRDDIDDILRENKSPNLKQFIKKEVVKLLKEDFDNPNNLPLASGNPLSGKSKESAKTLIRKIFGQIDHGQRYKDEAWENIRKIFKLFQDYNIDITVSGGEYNPGGINVDSMTPQWKKWNVDFDFIGKNDKPININYVLTAHAAGTQEDPWDSYDISFYPTN